MRISTRLATSVVTGVLACGALAACGTDNSGESGGSDSLTLWARDDSRGALEPLIEKWNADHTPTIKANFIDSDQYMTKLASAAGGNELPDIASSDIVYAPQLIQGEVFADITDQVKALSFADSLSPAHMSLATADGKIYAVPTSVDNSALFYNKDLFTKAGLDPDKPPANWADINDAATKIRATGGDTYGFWTSGNCAGCQAFTFLPLVWASGGDVLNEDGTKATMDDPILADAFDFYAGMVKADLVSPSSKNDDGKDFSNGFLSGNVGMAIIGGQQVSEFTKNPPSFDWGVTAIPGQNGGQATFGGGDVIGVMNGSDNADKAWEFLAWTLEEPQQVDIYAKNGWLTLRSDLADNQYTTGNPAAIKMNELVADGHTPYSTVYNQIFNDPTGPWLQMFRTAVYEGNTDQAVTDGQKAVEQIITDAQ